MFLLPRRLRQLLEVKKSDDESRIFLQDEEIITLVRNSAKQQGRCLGHRNYQIAEILVIAPETVKTHLQNIFTKFNLRSSKELRLVLKDWNFADWWEQNQQT